MCLRTLRRRRLRHALFGWLPGRDDQPPRDEIAERVHAEAEPAPADALVSRETLATMLRRLDELPAQQRAALVLRYGHDLPVPEVAELLGVGQATAKTHLVRGLAKLRDLMEES